MFRPAHLLACAAIVLCNDVLGAPMKHATLGVPLRREHMGVFLAARNEDDDSKCHGSCWDGEADCPGDVLLDVHDDRASDEGSNVHSEVEPVEEAGLLPSVLHHSMSSLTRCDLSQLDILHGLLVSTTSLHQAAHGSSCQLIDAACPT